MATSCKGMASANTRHQERGHVVGATWDCPPPGQRALRAAEVMARSVLAVGAGGLGWGFTQSQLVDGPGRLLSRRFYADLLVLGPQEDPHEDRRRRPHLAARRKPPASLPLMSLPALADPPEA